MINWKRGSSGGRIYIWSNQYVFDTINICLKKSIYIWIDQYIFDQMLRGGWGGQGRSCYCFATRILLLPILLVCKSNKNFSPSLTNTPNTPNNKYHPKYTTLNTKWSLSSMYRVLMLPMLLLSLQAQGLKLNKTFHHLWSILYNHKYIHKQTRQHINHSTI